MEEEVLAFESFLSECGGALGLFLGFSFLGADSTFQGCLKSVIQMAPGKDKGFRKSQKHKRTYSPNVSFAGFISECKDKDRYFCKVLNV